MSEKKLWDIESLATDAKSEVEGVWCDIGGGAQVKVARFKNEAYSRMIRKKFKANKGILEADDDMSHEVAEKISIEVYAHTILKDVKGIAIAGVEIAQYTPEIGMQLLAYKDFRERIEDLAKADESYRLRQDEAAVKS